MKFLFFLYINLGVFITGAFSQRSIDVLHYHFKINLTDNSDSIKGEAQVLFKVLNNENEFALDLTQSHDGKGMKVYEVKGAHVAHFRQENDKLIITLTTHSAENTEMVRILYSGIPADGLIISKNKYGERTFFADNWPNRAHHWLPCVDDPADKASFEFSVTAPSHYAVISNGFKAEEKSLSDHYFFTHWKEDIPLSTKVMVIGVARFAVKEFPDSPKGLPISAWIYPRDSANGFYDYSVAPEIVRYYSDYIGPFPYNKLANVQSTTRFGGMENASAIFYAENSVSGDRKWEEVIAHEIAHQWFGDMASEKSFAHLWLSEGFATYLTDLYMAGKYGKDSSIKRLKKERADVINFVKASNHPVVDSTGNLMSLLNENSYQKGSWILHMLRHLTGDSTFKQIIRSYYNQYKGSNADTRDFEKIAENVSGMDLKSFFDQWLYKPGVPDLKVSWKYTDSKSSLVTLNIAQNTNAVFQFPLEVLIVYPDGSNMMKTIAINKKNETVNFRVSHQPSELILDPNTVLLYTGKVAGH